MPLMLLIFQRHASWIRIVQTATHRRKNVDVQRYGSNMFTAGSSPGEECLCEARYAQRRGMARMRVFATQSAIMQAPALCRCAAGSAQRQTCAACAVAGRGKEVSNLCDVWRGVKRRSVQRQAAARCAVFSFSPETRRQSVCPPRSRTVRPMEKTTRATAAVVDTLYPPPQPSGRQPP